MPSPFRRLFSSASRRSSASAHIEPIIPPDSRDRGPSSADAASSTNLGSQINERDGNYGIKILHDAGAKAAVDIVFVHGLTGDAYNTWLDERSGVHWPSQLLKEDIADSRILSFEYDADVVKFWNPASSSRLSNHAESLVGDLVRRRERTRTEDRKIVFVAHSLGGLVTEQALVYSRNNLEKHLLQVERNTLGIVFLGTPHCGSDLAAWGVLGTRMAQILARPNKEIVAVLDRGSEMLRVVQNGFHTVLGLRKKEGRDIAITCFFEELPVKRVGEIVPFHSAELKGYSCYGIHANHMAMTKFGDRNDRGYDKILGELLRWVEAMQSIPLEQPRTEETASAAIFHGPINGGSVVGAVHGGYTYNHNESSTGTAPLKPSTIPREPGSLYIGREKIGEVLSQAFKQGPASQQTQQKVFVLDGIGGTGKSEVCLKFAADHADEFWGRFWIDCSSRGVAEDAFRRIGTLCNTGLSNPKDVKHWLSSRSERWLLVIDNADDPKIDYQDYMPAGKQGNVIITTRNPGFCAQFQTVGCETLDQLEEELAVQLLLRTALVPADQHGSKKEAASAIISTLGRHTLAIVQAGAYIAKKCPFDNFLPLYLQQRSSLLNFPKYQGGSPYESVHATFEVSVTWLESQDSVEARDALHLLRMLAFTHNSGDFELIFARAAEYALDCPMGRNNEGSPLIYSLSAFHVEKLPEFAPRDGAVGRVRWRDAVDQLKSFSLVKAEMRDDANLLSMHPLVHAWAKERLQTATQSEAWLSVASLLAMSCCDNFPFVPFFNILGSHVRACLGHQIRTYVSGVPGMEAAQMLLQLTSVQYWLYEYDQAGALDVIDEKLGENDNDSKLEVHYLQGLQLVRKGDIGAAVTKLQHVVAAREILAEHHPIRLALQQELARAYRADGRIGQAVELLEHVVAIRQRTLKEHLGDRLLSQQSLAIAYWEDRQVRKAVGLLEFVVAIQKKTLAEHHPDRLASQHSLAIAYQVDGQVKEAVALLEYVVAVREKTLAEDHPNRLASQHALALAYLADGQVGKAVQLLEHVVTIQKNTLAEHHPDRIASQHALAMVRSESYLQEAPKH